MQFLTTTIGRRQALRGLIAISAGLMLADTATTYGGIGVNLLFFAEGMGIPQQRLHWYHVVGFYSIVMTVLLALLALFFCMEFTDWKFRFAEATRLVVISLLCVFAIAHLFAIVNVVKIADPELKCLFVDTTIYYALSTLGIAILFSIVHLLRVKTTKPRSQQQQQQGTDHG